MGGKEIKVLLLKTENKWANTNAKQEGSSGEKQEKTRGKNLFWSVIKGHLFVRAKERGNSNSEGLRQMLPTITIETS